MITRMRRLRSCEEEHSKVWGLHDPSKIEPEVSRERMIVNLSSPNLNEKDQQITARKQSLFRNGTFPRNSDSIRKN